MLCFLLTNGVSASTLVCLDTKATERQLLDKCHYQTFGSATHELVFGRSALRAYLEVARKCAQPRRTILLFSGVDDTRIAMLFSGVPSLGARSASYSLFRWKNSLLSQ